MEAAATTLPSGIALEELLDWRPDFGVITVFVAIDPSDRSKGWLIELRKVLTSAVESRDDAHDRGRALEATAQRVLDRFDEEELPSGRCSGRLRRLKKGLANEQLTGAPISPRIRATWPRVSGARPVRDARWLTACESRA